MLRVDDSRVLRANCNFDKFAKFVDGVDNIEIYSEESTDSIKVLLEV